MPAGLEKEEKDLRRAEEEEEDQLRRSHAQQQATDRNQEASLSRDGAELRRKKDQLLAKMREIDDQNQVGQQAPLGRYSPLCLPSFTEHNYSC